MMIAMMISLMMINPWLSDISGEYLDQPTELLCSQLYASIKFVKYYNALFRVFNMWPFMGWNNKNNEKNPVSEGEGFHL